MYSRMKDNRSISYPVACFGEVLWDHLEQGLLLGGAPLNVAYHLMKLGCQSSIISAVGRDILGQLTLQRLKRSGLDVSCIDIIEEHPTGIADTKIDERGDATFEIRNPAAWDFIEPSQIVNETIESCVAIVYGSLSVRNSHNRKLLSGILSSFDGLKICDINLRPGYDIETVMEMATQADVLKVNESELFTLEAYFRDKSNLLDAANFLREKLMLRTLCVTRAEKPAALFDDARAIFATPPEMATKDTIGAGDAFTSCLTEGLLRGLPTETILERAVVLGSFVASQSGAQPDYDPDEVFGHARSTSMSSPNSQDRR